MKTLGHSVATDGRESGSAEPRYVKTGPGGKPTLIFVVTEDWFFCAHRLPAARAARDAGFDVAVATRVQAHGERIRAEGLRLVPMNWRRRSLNPFSEIGTIASLVRLYRRERPALVHHVALKPVLYGALAAVLTRVPARVDALTGLGFIFMSNGPVARLLRPLVSVWMGRLSRRGRGVVVVENRDDAALLAARGMAPAERITVVRGSGVDLGRYRPLPEPEGPVTVALVARMLADKGVGTLIEAQRLLRGRGVAIEVLLAGMPDPGNPTTIPQSQLTAWAGEPGITWLGQVADIREVWARAHIAVLPSRREGLPMALMEAAACGRPLVATDAPGCRDVAIPGETGLLVPVDDAEALAEALATLAGDAGLRRRLGAGARRLVEGEMSAESVRQRLIGIYRALTA